MLQSLEMLKIMPHNGDIASLLMLWSFNNAVSNTEIMTIERLIHFKNYFNYRGN
jgi:hypothetical protein